MRAFDGAILKFKLHTTFLIQLHILLCVFTDHVLGSQDDADEITWQTYKGQLTDRQEKTRSKIVKRMEKVSTCTEISYSCV